MFFGVGQDEILFACFLQHAGSKRAERLPEFYLDVDDVFHFGVTRVGQD